VDEPASDEECDVELEAILNPASLAAALESCTAVEGMSDELPAQSPADEPPSQSSEPPSESSMSSADEGLPKNVPAESSEAHAEDTLVQVAKALAEVAKARAEEPSVEAGPTDAADDANEGTQDEADPNAAADADDVNEGTREAAEGDGAGEAELVTSEKIGVIIAAFDADGDGHLDFGEICEMLKAAEVSPLPWIFYRHTCARLGADHQVGFSAQDLERVYAYFGNLERDFQAAWRKLQHEDERPAAQPTGEEANDATPEDSRPRPDSHPCLGVVGAASIALFAAPILALPMFATAVALGAGRRAHRRR